MIFNICYIQKSVQLLKLLEKKYYLQSVEAFRERTLNVYINTLIQDLGETIFVCAVTLIMRFVYSRKELCRLMLKLEFIGF